MAPNWNASALALRTELQNARNAGDTELAKVIGYEIDDARDALLDRERRQAGLSNSADPHLPSPLAETFHGIATGTMMPLPALRDRWLDASNYVKRSKSDARLALVELERWLVATNRPAVVETVNRRVAALYRDEWFVQRRIHPKTANKKMSLLRQFWAWLERAGERQDANPWDRLSLPKPQAHRISPGSAQEGERPFTRDEMRALMGGTTDQDLADMMRIAALSGLRIGEIGNLRVADVVDGVFRIHVGKSAAARRAVPIHSALSSIIARRIKDKDAAAFLIDGLPATGWDGNRTMAVQKRFATYRRRVGVDDRREGSRRSKVNFHSFRRWFITELEEAGIAENVVAKIVGHTRGTTESFRTYSQARLDAAMKEAVGKVNLPNP